jgi:hypothetical protein
MVQRDFTLPLKEATFPMVSLDQSRTIMGGSDRNTGAIEAPSVAYMHNVIPTISGLSSIGYIFAVGPAVIPTSKFTEVRIVYGDEGLRHYFGFTSDNRIHTLAPGTVNWTLLPTTITYISTTLNDRTVGTVNGVSYIYYHKTACYVYDESASDVVLTALTGLTAANILGVVGSHGYLIAYTENTLAWSSTIDPTDFTPSPVTGAGGGSPQELGGEISFILSNDKGILIYTESNVVAGIYTGNKQYPFKFTEVASSRGNYTMDHVAHEANATAQFSYSMAGLHALTSQRAELILPDVTDFLAGKVLEDYDEVGNTFTYASFIDPITFDGITMKKKLRLIGSRYLVISYGVTEFTHALVYDITLKRMGKLRITHVDCFEYTGEQVFSTSEEQTRESIAFLADIGTIRLADFNNNPLVGSSGVVILGKLQYTRNRLITLQELELEATISTPTVTAKASLDGKTTSSNIAGVASYGADGVTKYTFRATALNFSIAILGAFKLNTAFIKYTLNGRR